MFQIRRLLLLLTSGNQFHELPLRRRVLLSQLPLTTATVLVVLVDLVFTSGRALTDPWFGAGVAGVALLTVVSGFIPWQKLPTGSYWVIPLLDLVAIYFLAAGAFPVLFGVPMLAVMPVFWMAWSALHPRATLIVGFCATLVIACGQSWHAGRDISWVSMGQNMVMPVVVLGLGITTNIAVDSMMNLDRRLEAALEESRAQAELLGAVLNAVNVGVFAVDSEGGKVLVNERQHRHHLMGTAGTSGVPAEEQLLFSGAGHRGDRLPGLLPEDQVPVTRALRGEEFTDQLLWLGPEGEAEALAVSARQLTRPDGSAAGAVLVFKDVTALITASQVKDRFLANISHELRTPLTSILGYLELVQDFPGVPAPAVQFTQVAERNTHRLKRLVDDLLSSAGSGLGIKPEPIDLMEVVGMAVESHRGSAQMAGISLGLRGPVTLPVLADPFRIGQVIDNLVSNGVKYTQSGGTVDILVAATDDGARIQVADNGPGLDAEEQKQLFNRFFRTGSALRSSVPGTGLGLSISREIIEAHGGTLAVDSLPGRGCTFTVDLPLLL
ncbi:sensor histidine kinase [Paeniglutamicibacter cryotolerans]|uniref:histidine kinase n=1 Tax=Paeniglutamicibacter cryotolerans TaxID=670079 RepID=A0A839QNP9_9MICC|nr:PAS domain-containing sensor histidine kinase [Paeniglutamicibacter cryotolerans]MBB2995626.1 signal transduction histidine kinase [Paeniglutamicibacter cryotolerans]